MSYTEREKAFFVERVWADGGRGRLGKALEAVPLDLGEDGPGRRAAGLAHDFSAARPGELLTTNIARVDMQGWSST